MFWFNFNCYFKAICFCKLKLRRPHKRVLLHFQMCSSLERGILKGQVCYSPLVEGYGGVRRGVQGCSPLERGVLIGVREHCSRSFNSKSLLNASKSLLTPKCRANIQVLFYSPLVEGCRGVLCGVPPLAVST